MYLHTYMYIYSISSHVYTDVRNQSINLPFKAPKKKPIRGRLSMTLEERLGSNLGILEEFHLYMDMYSRSRLQMYIHVCMYVYIYIYYSCMYIKI